MSNNKEAKNQILEGREKKRDPVYMPELHSCPGVMSDREKLELAEELLCETIAPIRAREELDALVEDVQETTILLRFYPNAPENVVKEIDRTIRKTTDNNFSSKAIE